MIKIYLFTLVLFGLFTKDCKAQMWVAATPFDEPLNNDGGNCLSIVTTMEVFQNELYVAGDFTSVGSNQPTNSGLVAENIAKWNGINWSPVGIGNELHNFPCVTDMQVFNNKLYIATESRIFVWDGSVLSACSSCNLSGDKVFQIFNNELYVATFNSQLYKLNGNTWEHIALPGTGGQILDLEVFQNELYSSGTYGIFKLVNNVWQDVTNSLGGQAASTGKMAVFNNELYANVFQGDFSGQNMHWLAKFNGTSWTQVQIPYTIILPASSLFDINVHNGQLYAAITANNNGFWKFDGINWSIVANNPSAQLTWHGFHYSSIVFQNELYSCGNFGILKPNSSQEYYPAWNTIVKLDPLAVSVPEIDVTSNIKVVPNPSSSTFVVQLTTDYIGTNYYVFNQLGNPIVNGKVVSEDIEIDMSNFSEGIYWLKFENSLYPVKKLIKI